jgi:aldose 1-epimerase
MPLPERLTIRNGPMMARFSPQQGGRMTHLAHEVLGNILVPMGEGVFDPWHWPKAGAYPLFPYHNRLAGAAFRYAAQDYTLLPHPALGADAMHGPAHRRAWSVLSHGSNTVELSLDYRADADWPFDFTAIQRFRLNSDGVDIELVLRNSGTVSMPGGFGWHPYLAIGAANLIRSDAALNWPRDAVDVPTGEAPDPRQPAPPLPTANFTIHLSDWKTMDAVLDGGARIHLTADAALPHLVAHRTPAYACLEPVSHIAGAFGFSPEKQQWAGLLQLKRGEEVTGKVCLSIRS